MKPQNILIAYTSPTSKEQHLTLKEVSSVLRENNIGFVLISRDNLNDKITKSKDLIITIGGDGTFLKAASHVFDNTPILGVNSDPMHKEGFFLTATRKDFKRKFKAILLGKNKTRKLQRLEARIGNKKIPKLALNEFYVATEKPYLTARYYLKVGRIRERQKSTGILVSTAAGSHSWAKSAGGKPLPIESDRFEYVVREQYCGRITGKCRLRKGILSRNGKIEIEFEFGHGVIIADSWGTEYKFKAGEKVTIKQAKKPIMQAYF